MRTPEEDRSTQWSTSRRGTFATDAAGLTIPTIQTLADDDLLVVVICPDSGALGTLPRNVRTAQFIPIGYCCHAWT